MGKDKEDKIIVMVWYELPDQNGHHISELKEFKLNHDGMESAGKFFNEMCRSDIKRLDSSVMGSYGYFMKKNKTFTKRGHKHYFIYRTNVGSNEGVNLLFTRFSSYYKGTSIAQYKRDIRLSKLLSK